MAWRWGDISPGLKATVVVSAVCLPGEHTTTGCGSDPCADIISEGMEVFNNSLRGHGSGPVFDIELICNFTHLENSSCWSYHLKGPNNTRQTNTAAALRVILGLNQWTMANLMTGTPGNLSPLSFTCASSSQSPLWCGQSLTNEEENKRTSAKPNPNLSTAQFWNHMARYNVT